MALLYCRYAVNEHDPSRFLEPYINNIYRRYLERLIRQVGRCVYRLLRRHGQHRCMLLLPPPS